MKLSSKKCSLIKKTAIMALTAILTLGLLTGCAGSGSDSGSDPEYDAGSGSNPDSDSGNEPENVDSGNGGTVVNGGETEQSADTYTYNELASSALTASLNGSGTAYTYINKNNASVTVYFTASGVTAKIGSDTTAVTLKLSGTAASMYEESATYTLEYNNKTYNLTTGSSLTATITFKEKTASSSGDDEPVNPNVRPSVPENLAVQIVTENAALNQVKVTWNETSTKNYRVVLAETSSIVQNIPSSYDKGYRAIVTDKTEAAFGLPTANQYSIYVQSWKNEDVYSDLSSPVTVQLSEHVSAVPQILSAQIDNRVVDITWNDCGQTYTVYGRAETRSNPITEVFNNISSSSSAFSNTFPDGYSDFTLLSDCMARIDMYNISVKKGDYSNLYLFVAGDYGKNALVLSDVAYVDYDNKTATVKSKYYTGEFTGDTNEKFAIFGGKDEWKLTTYQAALDAGKEIQVTYTNPYTYVSSDEYKALTISGILKDADGNSIDGSNLTSSSTSKGLHEYVMNWDTTKDYYVTLSNDTISKKLKINFSKKNSIFYGEITVSEAE